MASTHLINFTIMNSTPRGESLDRLLVKYFCKTIAQIRDIKELCVPTSDNVWLNNRPLMNKLTKQVNLISTVNVSYIITIVLKFMQAPDHNFFVLMIFKSNRQKRLFCLSWIWKSIFTLHLNVNRDNTDFIFVPRHIIRILITDIAIGILIVAEDYILIFTTVVPIFCFFDRSKLMWLYISSI